MEGQKNRYHFVAVSSDGKKFSGTLWAESEDDAREKIFKRGLALFSIEKFTAKSAAVTEGFMQFEFEGTGADGKPVHGTIEAIDGYEAYQKLRKEYDFELKNVIDISASVEDREQYKKQGIPAEWVEQFNLTHKAKTENKQGKKKKADGPLLSPQDQAELLFYQEEIGRLTTEVLKLLDENEEFLDAPARRAILDRIGLLSRLRRSNAIDHLRELTKKILAQLNDDKLFIEAETLSEEKQLELAERRELFGTFSKDLNKKIISGIASISIGMASIDTEKVKAQIIESDPLRKFIQIFYILVVTLLGLMMVFWGVNIVRLLTSFSQNSTLFFFSSPILWLITGVSLIFTFGLFPVVYGWEHLSPKKKIIIIGILIAVVIVFLWISPMLFWWTR